MLKGSVKNYKKLHREAQIQLHSKRYNSTAITKIRVHSSRELGYDDTIIAGSNIPLDVSHTFLGIPSAWILPHKRAHEDKRNVTVLCVFQVTWAVRLLRSLRPIEAGVQHTSNWSASEAPSFAWL